MSESLLRIHNTQDDLPGGSVACDKKKAFDNLVDTCQ